MSIYVVRAFVKLKEMLSGHKDILKKLDELERRIEGHDQDLHSLFEVIRELLTKPAIVSKIPHEKHPKVRGFESH